MLRIRRLPALGLSILASRRPEDQVQPNQNDAGNLNPDHSRSPNGLRSNPHDDLQVDWVPSRFLPVRSLVIN
jgi:hypothetical protein